MQLINSENKFVKDLKIYFSEEIYVERWLDLLVKMVLPRSRAHHKGLSSIAIHRLIQLN